MMHFKETKLKGVYVGQPDVYRDHRGCFLERFRLDEWKPILGQIKFIQENESFSTQGVLRGLHFQLPPYSQSKLVQVAWGSINDIVVDMRPDSSTFGQYHLENLDDKEKRQIFIPSGFAHGFVVLSPEAVVQYKVDVPYHPVSERTLRFDDPFLRIEWGVPTNSFILSDKDRLGLFWEEAITQLEN
jgi:dTDP-4-dehydrorhamnose 3,5-epimerase